MPTVIASSARTACAAVATTGVAGEDEGEAGGHQHSGHHGQVTARLEAHSPGEQAAEPE